MTCRPLQDVLAEVPDPRQAQGRRYPLGAILALVCAATLCGYETYGAMAEWGANYGGELVRSLGFRNDRTPCAATLHNVLKKIDLDALERAIERWVRSLVRTYRRLFRGRLAISFDGKTLRGSKKQGARGTHLLSMVSHALGLTIFQQAVDDKSTEIPALHAVLDRLVLAGQIVTVDALHTQRETATAILAAQADYVMVAKDNQRALVATITAVLATPSTLAAPLHAASTRETSRGRTDQRTLTVRALLPGDSDWPGAQHVWRLDRRRMNRTTGELTTETVLGITSLPPADATPRKLLRLIRGHWTIENKVHYVRDVTFDEDRSQVRTGAIPQTMATLRNLSISLMRLTGRTNIAAACRWFAAHPADAATLLTVPLEN